MIDTKALRSKVLDLAIQGKLTQQLESDGTAEELYQQIQEEKQKLIKEGKIKKEKALPPIKDDEIPFEIPSNWKLVRFSEIIKLQSGQDLTKQEYNDNNTGIPYITGASNYNDDGSLIINRWTETPKAIAKIGDILISCKGTVGKITILKIDKVHIARQIMGIRVFCIDNIFAEMFLQSVVNGIKNAQKGLIPGIERNDILSLAICLPPLAEQKRIVERVEEIFKLLDIIDEAQKKYSADAEILKSKLITMGIQGKLTKQLDSDGTAEELYQQIQEEKQKLIKEGKMKKEKVLPPVSEEEIPFDIPSNWVWCRFGEVSNIKCTGLVRSGQEQFKQATYYYFKMQNIDNTNGKCNYNSMVMIDASPEEFEKYKLEENDFLFNTRNSIELVGKTAVVHNLPNVNTILNNNILKIGFFGEVNADFVNYFFISEIGKKLLLQFISSTTNVAAIYQRQLITLTIPLPPLAEQKRIADTLDEVLRVIG